MGGILWSVLAFLVALGVLITVHEFGHFWVARRCGVRVERFSIGFGKALWRRVDRQGTEYVVAAIPLGGYVKMLDERVESVAPEWRHQAFNNKSVLQRAAIVSAGPIANFVFAIIAYWLVFVIGVPSVRPVIADVTPDSIAAAAHITPGMELKSVDGVDTPDWESVRLALVGQIGDGSTTLGVGPFGSHLVSEKTLDLRRWQFDPERQDPVVSLGIIPRGPTIEPVLAEIQKGSAAQKAGLQVGDRIVKVNGVPIRGWRDFALQIRDNPDRALALDVERAGQPASLTLTPESRRVSRGLTEGFAGVVPQVIPLPEEYQTIRQYGPFVALYQATDKTWQLMKLTVSMLGKLITGDVKLNNLGGPISIAQGAGASAEYGLVYYLMFLALISVNLGIINLFPLPVLDGGHLLFLALEKLKGGPVSERVQAFGYRIGVILLMLFMGLALFNDFSRL
ncbi:MULTISPECIES: sigma E protease regulator RseP [Edwardsiella]|uniref:Zinc metalloprotease n=2 Tax=Edwardsiella anguillarum TaxID=1821960 RepID=A0A076LTP6_9GAMM|nr:MULTISPECIES: sigma E protease regulator RseP [Edwardsiella]AKM48705.1 zinc metallopeptidase RseP [Edwardsiella sp. EA181011]GAJ66765.1 membrane-associated zinc metalloprotease [Edwardsiella piscicida]AIJ08944.1 RIP metalloprotease RseP [Edwardsiella anguillarum ET080813]AKR76925.1 sigma E protease regulator RseP [Edwardsiella sp. LADL05-105]KAB0592297.1 sigma E protease regulator RseP [Edwardsiella anguillarum]